MILAAANAVLFGVRNRARGQRAAHLVALLEGFIDLRSALAFAEFQLAIGVAVWNRGGIVDTRANGHGLGLSLKLRVRAMLGRIDRRGAGMREPALQRIAREIGGGVEAPRIREALALFRARRGIVLSRRELRLIGVARGERSKEIAARLGITERTVKAHLASIYNKFGVDSRAAAIAVASQRGLLPKNL